MPPSKRADSNAAVVARALADPGRAMHRAADARRHPAELVELSGVREGQSVLDLIPGDGYWRRIFSKIVGPRDAYLVWPAAYAKLAKSNVETLKAMSASADCTNVTGSYRRAPISLRQNRSTLSGARRTTTTTTILSWASPARSRSRGLRSAFSSQTAPLW